MADIDNKIILGIFALFSGIYAWLIRHLFVKAQFKDVCQANRDCIETKIESLEKLLNQRFDNLESLIKNNGHSKPRIQT